MKEETLQYIWQYQLFNSNNLLTTQGEPVVILNRGTLNKYSGPDFLNAKVKIGSVEWVGNIEIHINSSSWFAHKHQLDESYNNVVLHVVLNYDKQKSPTIPTIVLNDRVSSIFEENYTQLLKKQNFIPCEKLIHNISEFDWKLWKETLIIERLSRKADAVKPLIQKHKNDWESVFYHLLAYSLGLKSNETSMLLLAEKLPLKIILKYKNNLHQIEALLFGVAGLLEDEINDSYYIKLKKEYKFLKTKHNLNQIKTSWNFGKIRPSSFPTLGLAYLSSLIQIRYNIFGDLRSLAGIKSIWEALDCTTSPYWDNHYRFGKESTYKPKTIGHSKRLTILLNAIIPLRILYAKQIKEDNSEIERILSLMRSISKENNTIIKNWKAFVPVQNAYDSQALLELYNQYCTQKKCLHCRLGYKILKG